MIKENPIIRASKILFADGFSGLKRSGMRYILKKLDSGMWTGYRNEALSLSRLFNFNSNEIQKSISVNTNNKGLIKIKKVAWFIPDFTNPNYGGIHTILRFAEYLQENHQIENNFFIVGTMDDRSIRKLITSSFPKLDHANIYTNLDYSKMEDFPESDACIATLWSTAYIMLRYNQTKRKFYFIQDFEPLFYPAGSIHAQVEATLKFGFIGLTNTPSLKDIYESYGGIAEFFTPCVDLNLFNNDERSHHYANSKKKLFFYGRPDHPRNGFELGIEALRIVKQNFGDDVEIYAAGGKWEPSDYTLKGIVSNLGILSLKQTANLYRQCDAGLVLMFTRHPSYLPFELMASSCLVITNENPATNWFLKNETNCLLSLSSPSCIAETIMKGLQDNSLRRKITTYAYNDISQNYSDWSREFGKIFTFMQAQ